MKEKIYTIPLMDAFRADDECPFCFIEKNLEQHAMDFVLGSGASYMEDDVRAETDMSAILTPSLNCTGKILNSQICSKTAKASASPISVTLWRLQSPFSLIKRRLPFMKFSSPS